MSAEEVLSHIERIDRAVRDGEEIAKDDRSINITDLYKRYGWGHGAATPFPPDALKRLNMSERTTDERWIAHFRRKGRRQIGVYRSLTGSYWLLRYDPAIGEHWLDLIGSAHDTAVRFGEKSQEKKA